MKNTLNIPHFDEERSFSELREEFREQNLQRVRSMLHMEVSKVGPLRYHYLSDGKSAQVDCSLTEDGRWLSTHAFPVSEVPERLLAKLGKDAEAAVYDTTACLPEGEGVDHDGPPLFGLSDEDVLAYTARLVEEK